MLSETDKHTSIQRDRNTHPNKDTDRARHNDKDRENLQMLRHKQTEPDRPTQSHRHRHTHTHTHPHTHSHTDPSCFFPVGTGWATDRVMMNGMIITRQVESLNSFSKTKLARCTTKALSQIGIVIKDWQSKVKIFRGGPFWGSIWGSIRGSIRGVHKGGPRFVPTSQGSHLRRRFALLFPFLQ